MLVIKKPSVYVAMSADIIHPGHIKIINKAESLGSVTVGVLSNRAVASYKRVPIMDEVERLQVVSAIRGVDNVILQDTLSYRENLEKIRPDFVVHGTDWQVGIQKETRQEVIDTIASWGGQLVEMPYTEGVSSSALIASLQKNGVTPEYRAGRLVRSLAAKELVRIIEVHNGLSALVAETTRIRKDSVNQEFDGMWLSSLSSSTSRAKPDIELVDLSSRLDSLRDILDATTKLMIFDGDTGGTIENLVLMTRTLERLGVSALIIEDKIGGKRNSLLADQSSQKQASVMEFCQKIQASKSSQVTESFQFVARIESLILGKGLIDALSRAEEYLSAGANGIMIHSKSPNPDEVFEFAKAYEKFRGDSFLVAVPSTYSRVSEQELIENHFDVVIYANHLIRSVYPAMLRTATSILESKSSAPIEDSIASINEIIRLTD